MSFHAINIRVRGLREWCGVAGAAIVMLASVAASAQQYPSKPLRLIIPYPPGGGIDIVGRPLALRMSETLGQQVVVEHKGGANGSIAMEYVAKSPADGYTIVLALNTQLAVNPSLYSALRYDPLKDFAPIALLGSAPYVLVVNPKLPVNSVQQLIAYAKSHPGKLNYASSGNGSGAHLAGELLKSTSGVDIIHVPYKATADAVRDTMTGDAQIMFATFGSVRGQLEAKTLRAIAVSGLKRSPLAPELPTVAESGFPGFETVVWYGILAPAGTPADIVTRLHGDIGKALASPEYRDRLRADAVELTGSTPAQFQRYIGSELTKYTKIVKDSGAKLD